MKGLIVATCIASALCTSSIFAQQQSRVADSARAAAFDRLDRTARTLLSTIYCARKSAQGRATGLLGPIDSVGRRGQCLRIRGRSFGVFFTPDSTFTTARQLGVIDIEKQARYVDALDTAAVLAEARAATNAVRKGFPSFQREKRQFAPLSIRTDGDTIEVWLVPAGSVMVGTSASVGGERGYIYSPDGRTLVREIDAFDRYRAVPLPDSGQVKILSQEDDLPLVSELIVANLLHSEGREVQIVTKAYASQLVGNEPNAMWLQVHRR